MRGRGWLPHGTGISVLSALALTACSVIDPYVEPGIPRPGIAREVDGSPRLDDNRQPRPVHVSVDVAREYARFVQDAYRTAASEQSAARAVFDFALINLALAAIGQAAIAGDAHDAARLGIAGAGVAFIADRYLRNTHKQLYFRGALALECVVDAANRFPSRNDAALLVVVAALPLRDALAALRQERNSFQAAVAKAKPNAAVGQLAAELVLRADAAAQTGEMALALAAETSRKLDPLGQILLSKVEEVRLLVDAEVARQEPDPLRFDTALRDSLSTSATAFGGLPKVQPELPGRQLSALGFGPSLQAEANSLRDAIERVSATRRDLLLELSKVSDFSGVAIYPADLFNNCMFMARAEEPLSFTAPSLTLPSGGVARVASVAIVGGKPPFQPQLGSATKGVKAQAEGRILTVTVNGEQPAGETVTVPVQDAAGKIALFTVRFGPAAVEEKPAAAPAVPIVPVAQPCEPEARVKNAQQVLLSAGIRLPNFGADGCWGEETQEAMRAYLLTPESRAKLLATGGFADDADVQAKLRTASRQRLLEWLEQLAAARCIVEPAVKAAQERLKAKGVGVATDGCWSATLHSAIAKHLTDNFGVLKARMPEEFSSHAVAPEFARNSKEKVLEYLNALP